MRRNTSGEPSKRGSRGFGLDPRLIIGLVLVASSIGGVWVLINAVDDSIEVYSAQDPLAPGDRVTASDLVLRSVKLDDTAPLYLLPGDIPVGGVVVTRAVAAGELVPASAIGSAEGVRVTSIVLSVDGQLASSIRPGSTVDVWAASEEQSGQFGSPTAIVTAAGVVRLVSSEGIVGAGQTTAVEILVPKGRVARVLEALANGDAVSVVPASLPGKD